MDPLITNPELIVYNHIEFFFSKEDLKSMMTIKPLSYEPWLDTLYDLYSAKPDENDKSFHYNIKHTEQYANILKHLTQIEKITNGVNIQKTEEEKKKEIKNCIIEI